MPATYQYGKISFAFFFFSNIYFRLLYRCAKDACVYKNSKSNETGWNCNEKYTSVPLDNSLTYRNIANRLQWSLRCHELVCIIRKLVGKKQIMFPFGTLLNTCISLVGDWYADAKKNPWMRLTTDW